MTDVLMRCEVCGGLLDEEDLFCANCGTAAELKASGASGTVEYRTQTVTHNFTCQGCGASMSYSAETSSLRCPSCGRDALTNSPEARVLEAQGIVPFRITQDEATRQLQAFLGSSFWHPSDLKRSAAVTELRAVFVPYWVFSAETHTYWTADSGNVPFGARGDWVPVGGEHRSRYQGSLVGASGALTPAETAEICPFDLRDALPPGQAEIGPAIVEQFTVQRKYARPLARAGFEEAEMQACAEKFLTGRYRNLRVNMRIENLTSEPVLLPLWIMAYRYKHQLYRFIVNGQTGKAAGHAPLSIWKGVMVALVVIVTLLGALFLLLAMNA